MKKILFTALLLGGGLSAQAQQLPNSDFSNWKTECGTTYCWSASSLNSFNTQEERKRPGVEPESWEGGNLNQKNLTTVSKSDLVTKYTENNLTAVKLMNIKPSSLSSLRAPGFISFAHPWVYPSSKSAEADGGVYGSLSFSYKPDAIETRIKRTVATAENAHIIAYLWNGTFKSNIGSANNPSKEVEDADRAVIGRITPTQSGKLIASVDYEFAQTTNQDWETITIPLEYKAGMESETPTKINVIFSAADYWTRGNMKENNVLYVDNVKLIYYSTLSTLTYDGTNLLPTTGNDNGATINIDKSNTLYQEGKIATALKGVGASVLSEGYDAATGLYTIQVAGNDNVNGSNVTTYNIQFMKQVTIEAGKDIQTTAGKAQVTMIRDFKQGWNTVCLPFLTDVTSLGATKAQEFYSDDEQSVTFKEVDDGMLKANIPYLVYFAEAKSFTSSNPFTAFVDLQDSQAISSTSRAFTFHGNYKNGMSMNGLYGVANVNGIQRLCKGGAGATLPAGCAYFTTTSQKANSFAINFDGQSTGIADATIDNGETRAAVYNLQGIKVSTNGTTSLPAGIYIQGGRKVIVK